MQQSTSRGPQPGTTMTVDGVLSRISTKIDNLTLPKLSLPQIGAPDFSGGFTYLSNKWTSFRDGTGSCFSAIGTSLSKVISSVDAPKGIPLPDVRWLLTPAYRVQTNIDVFDDVVITTADNATRVQYYSQDPIKNMQIKVSVRKINPNNYFGSEDMQSEREVYTATIAWQEKLFSPKELLMYHRLSEPRNALQRMYKTEISELLTDTSKRSKYQHREMQNEDQNNTNEIQSTSAEPQNAMKDLLCQRLFTYVDSDNFSDTYLIQEPVQHDPINSTEPVDRSRPQTMHIMLALGQNNNGSESSLQWSGDEYTLCVIQAFNDGSFSMKPGLSFVEDQDESTLSPDAKVLQLIRKFTSSQQRGDNDKQMKNYVFRTKTGDVYEYTLSLYNEQKKDIEIDTLRKRILKQLYERSLTMRRNLVGTRFTSPPADPAQIRVHITGEIISAENFMGDQIYLRYLIELPSQWKCEGNDSLLSSTTQTAKLQPVFDDVFSSRREAVFSLPFEVHATTDSLYVLPKIYFQVFSSDGWDRHRVEGYGHATIPADPGCHEVRVNTWKGIGSVEERLQDFFIGGSMQLEDVTYPGIPQSFNRSGRFLNKFGVLTMSSGSVLLRVQCIFHSRQFREK